MRLTGARSARHQRKPNLTEPTDAAGGLTAAPGASSRPNRSTAACRRAIERNADSRREYTGSGSKTRRGIARAWSALIHRYQCCCGRTLTVRRVRLSERPRMGCAPPAFRGLRTGGTPMNGLSNDPADPLLTTGPTRQSLDPGPVAPAFSLGPRRLAVIKPADFPVPSAGCESCVLRRGSLGDDYFTRFVWLTPFC